MASAVGEQGGGPVLSINAAPSSASSQSQAWPLRRTRVPEAHGTRVPEARGTRVPGRWGRDSAAPLVPQSTVCEKIMELLGQNEVDHRQRKVVILSQDRFYKVLTADQKAKALKGQYNFDHPGKAAGSRVSAPGFPSCDLCKTRITRTCCTPG